MISRYQHQPIAKVWQDQHKFAKMLQVELSLAKAQAKEDIIPEAAVNNLIKKVKTFTINVGRVEEIEKSVKHDVIAFLTHLEEELGSDAKYLHFGVTSSDIIDTAFALQLIDSIDLISKELYEVIKSLETLATKYQNTLTIGRSHGIHAEITTFGVKIAGFICQFSRSLKMLLEAKDYISFGQLSGPVGTYSGFSSDIEENALKELNLKSETVSTQVIPRDRHAFVFFALATIASAIESVSTEIRHLQRTEVAEASEGFSKKQKGSSAMPHKKNPILSENLSGIARLIRSYVAPSMENINLWHERDISHSSVERIIAPDATTLTGFALSRLQEVLNNLVIDSDKMMENIQLTGGAVFAGHIMLALIKTGAKRQESYEIVQKHALKADKNNHLQKAMLEDEFIANALGQAKIKDIFEGKNMTKNAKDIVNKALLEAKSITNLYRKS